MSSNILTKLLILMLVIFFITGCSTIEPANDDTIPSEENTTSPEDGTNEDTTPSEVSLPDLPDEPSDSRESDDNSSSTNFSDILKRSGRTKSELPPPTIPE